MLPERLKNSIITTITVAWAVSLILHWAWPSKYDPDPQLNGLFSLVVAAVLVTKKKDKEE